MRHRIALDPGMTTGLAFWDNQVKSFSSSEMPFMDALNAVWTWLHWHAGETEVIYEKFIIGPETLKKTRQYWSIETIGAIKWMCRHYGADDPIGQTAADAKMFSTNDKLKAVGFYQPGKGHANDASRHLLLRLVKCSIIPPGLT